MLKDALVLREKNVSIVEKSWRGVIEVVQGRKRGKLIMLTGIPTIMSLPTVGFFVGLVVRWFPEGEDFGQALPESPLE
ncbi:hypothetical protein ACFLV6_03880 [Chloroflexota bacterium]